MPLLTINFRRVIALNSHGLKTIVLRRKIGVDGECIHKFFS